MGIYVREWHTTGGYQVGTGNLWGNFLFVYNYETFYNGKQGMIMALYQTRFS